MRGVSKDKNGYFIAYYGKKFRKAFKTYEQAVFQREEWENSYGKFMTKAEKEAGNKIGNLTIVGDTGKRSKDGGVILLAKDEQENYKEVLSNNLFSKPYLYTGWTPERYEIAKKNGNDNIDILHSKVIFEGKNLSALSKEESQPNSKTGYRGILWSENSKRWIANVQAGNKNIFNASFKNFKDAVRARNNFVLTQINPLLEKYDFPKINPIHGIKMNSYVQSKIEGLKKYDELIEKNRLLMGLKKIRDSKGVSFKKDKNKWKAYARENGRQKHLGYFETEQEAINAKRNYVKTVIEPQIQKLQEEINHGV